MQYDQPRWVVAGLLVAVRPAALDGGRGFARLPRTSATGTLPVVQLFLLLFQLLRRAAAATPMGCLRPHVAAPHCHVLGHALVARDSDLRMGGRGGEGKG